MAPDRLRVVTALGGDGGWRADLAIDRAVTPARAVLLARIPPAMASTATALAALARGIDLAVRINHPAVRRVLGVAEAGGDMVVLEAWREGETLEWLLRTGGPLSPPLVSRIAIELAGALQAVHTLEAAGGRSLAHGDLRAERVLLGDDGSVLLCGLGRPSSEEGTPGSDLRALARLTAECLPPGDQGIPPPLAAVLERALGSQGYGSAREFGDAVEGAVLPAPPGALASRLEAVLPPGQPAWQARRAALAQAFQLEAEGPPAGSAPAEAEPAPASRPVRPAEAAAPPRLPGATPPAMPIPKLVAPPLGTSPTQPASIPARPVEAPEVAPIPPGMPTHPNLPEAAADDDSAPAYVEVTPAVAAATAPVARPAATSRPSWLQLRSHPRAPMAVGVVAAILGLLLGLWLGKR